MSKEAEHVKKILQPILDCFTGADGGISYINLRDFMEDSVKAGTAEDCMETIERFSYLIDFIIKNPK